MCTKDVVSDGSEQKGLWRKVKGNVMVYVKRGDTGRQMSSRD